ncbi:MAG: AraC family transcriptional regulator, partial [Oscillospiraceae bacterium]
MSNNRYDSAIEDFQRINAKLVYISMSKYENDWNNTPHTHQFTEFFYVLKGKGRFFVDGNSFDVKQDDCIVINPNVEHTEFSLNANPLEYAALGIEGISFHFNNKTLQDSYDVYNYREYREEVLFYLKIMLRELQGTESYNETVYNNILEVLVIHMMRYEHFNMTVIPPKATNKEMGQIRRYIDANFKHNITLDDLAKVGHINKYYLVHAFKKSYGISPINYLIAKRIEESKHLLKNTNTSLSKIAHIVGFSSPSYFSQSFKIATGKTPNAYRKEKAQSRNE